MWNSHEEILDVWKADLKLAQELPEVLAHGMGNYMYLAHLESKEKMEEFFRYTLELCPPELVKPARKPAARNRKAPAKTTTKRKE